jgi:hypothetical protein
VITPPSGSVADPVRTILLPDGMELLPEGDIAQFIGARLTVVTFFVHVPVALLLSLTVSVTVYDPIVLGAVQVDDVAVGPERGDIVPELTLHVYRLTVPS